MALNLTGEQYGRLLVESQAPNRGRHRYWNCRCACGAYKTVEQDSLRQGATKSCGCFRDEQIRKAKTIHGATSGCSRGGSKPVEYSAWCAMRRRCNNPNYACFHRYGGRGIKVCKRWNVYQNFLDDMGLRPSAEHSLDRINNDGDYCPENCRWATREEQSNNSSACVLLETKGGRKTISQWARENGVPPKIAHYRIASGWSPEKAVSTPLENPQTLTWNGESLSISEWSKKTGIGRPTLGFRLRSGWSIQAALSSPIMRGGDRASKEFQAARKSRTSTDAPDTPPARLPLP